MIPRNLLLVLCLGAGVAPASAQDMPDLGELAPEALAAGRMMLDTFPLAAETAIEELAARTGERRRLADSEACLSALQGVVTAGALTANLLPFASAATLEDGRGPVGRVRALIDGRKIHFEAHCEGADLVTADLEWDEGRGGGDDPVPYRRGTFDAALGLLLLGAMNGVFDGEAGLAAPGAADEGAADR